MLQQEAYALDETDFFNYHAIFLLELMGNHDPSQLEIDLVEDSLKNICHNLAPPLTT
jgi:hypothetical protein